MPINFKNLFSRIRYQLPLGASNRAADLENTGNWSYEAHGVTEGDDDYTFFKKDKETPHEAQPYQRFFFSTWTKDENKNAEPLDEIDELAIDTAKCYVGRVGNCRERNGLLLTYLLEDPYKGEINKIYFVNMYKPIDHQLLLLELKDGNRYYVDPWTEQVVNYNDLESYLPKLLDIIIKNEQARAIAQEGQAQLENKLLNAVGQGYSRPSDLKSEIQTTSKRMITYCKNAKKNLELVVDKIEICEMFPQQQARFLEMFHKNKDKFVENNYPKRPK